MLPIRMGGEVTGPSGKLGEVSRVVINPANDRITHVVVKRGLLAGTERLVPIEYFRDNGKGALFLNAETGDLEQFSTFDATNYRAPDPDYAPPQELGDPDPGVQNFQLNTFVAFGPLNGLAPAAPAVTFPAGEPARPRDADTLTVNAGTDVFDADGEKVGEVAEFDIDQEGHPRRLVVRRGFLFHSETEIPATLIGDVSSEGVTLNQRRDALERRAS